MPGAMPGIGRRQEGEQRRGIVVEAVERHPGDRTLLRWAHSARRVDLPYPAGAVTPTTRRPLERAEAIREARETEPRAGGSGTDSLASSRS